MRKLFIAAFIVIGTFALTACSSTQNNTATKTEESSETNAETSDEDKDEADKKSKSKEPNYVHGEDGYYCIYDEMSEFNPVIQKWGTCWLYAGSASMRTAYFKQTGEYITIDPIELLDIIYGGGADKEEGFVIKSGADGREVGGWQWMLTDTLSRGFNGLTLDSSMDIDINDTNKIKEVVRTRGAVVAEIPDTGDGKKGVHGGCFTMNDTETKEFDHDVTIVGYDDHFPKEYFNEEAERDGAWLTYNSNYKSDKPYYISYCTPIGYAISHTVSDQYTDVLSYDAGNEMDRTISTGDATKTANVFHKAGKLAAVGTYNVEKEQDIKIEIYDAAFNNVIYSQDAVLDFKGYHTIVLDEVLDVTDYAVVITYSKGAPVEGETLENDSGYYRTISESGQSYVYIDGWKDLTDDDIKDVLKIDFEPNNCCIKALYK